MLLAFDAAAKTGSFTAAAKQLNLTQGAISRQIFALENQLNVVLFERKGKVIKLTDVGKTYVHEIREALQVIRNASINAMTNPLNGTLNLAILPTFGTRWLMPRFPLFLKAHPEITVNFASKLSPFNFDNESLHSAIHYGSPDWPNTVSTFLMNEKAIPVCSPALSKLYSMHEPEHLSDMPLLHLETRADAWHHWFQVKKLPPPKEQGMLFEEFSIITQAAVAGIGVALLPKFLIRGELSRNELVAIDNSPLDSDSSYYLMTPADKVDYAPVIAFRLWLLNMVKNKSEIADAQTVN